MQHFSNKMNTIHKVSMVTILVLMEWSLQRVVGEIVAVAFKDSFNPCFDGMISATSQKLEEKFPGIEL